MVICFVFLPSYSKMDSFAYFREHYWYFEPPEVWSQDELVNDDDDLRAYWVVASLPMEATKHNNDFEKREDVFWLKHFGNRKNNAIFHMNGRKYFHDTEKIRDFLHVREPIKNVDP